MSKQETARGDGKRVALEIDRQHAVDLMNLIDHLSSGGHLDMSDNNHAWPLVYLSGRLMASVEVVKKENAEGVGIEGEFLENLHSLAELLEDSVKFSLTNYLAWIDGGRLERPPVIVKGVYSFLCRVLSILTGKDGEPLSPDYDKLVSMTVESLGLYKKRTVSNDQ